LPPSLQLKDKLIEHKQYIDKYGENLNADESRAFSI